MTVKARRIASIIKTADECDIILPWTRGKRRAAFIEKRKAADVSTRKSA